MLWEGFHRTVGLIWDKPNWIPQMKEIGKQKKTKTLTWNWPQDFTHIGEKERKGDEKKFS